MIYKASDIKTPIALGQKYVEIDDALFHFHRIGDVPHSHHIRFLVSYFPCPTTLDPCDSDYLGMLVFDGEENNYTFLLNDKENIGEFTSFQAASLHARLMSRF